MKRRYFLKGLAAGGAAAAVGACRAEAAPAGAVRVSQDIPVLVDYDVCVVGAGPGGVGAAIAAARAGKRTILVEHYGYPGGVGTNCDTPTFFFDPYKGVQYLRGIADEFVRRLARRGAAWFLTHDERCQPDYSRPVGDLPILDRVRTRVEDMRVAYHDFLDEAGVEKLFYTHLTGAVRDGDRITVAIVDCLEGRRAIRAKVFIDATGAAHLVHRAGGRTRLAPPDKTMHKSIWARLSPGPHDTPEVFRENRRTFDRLYREHRDRLSKYIWTSLAIGLASGYVNGNSCESWDMTRMDAEMRRRNFGRIGVVSGHRDISCFPHACFSQDSQKHRPQFPVSGQALSHALDRLGRGGRLCACEGGQFRDRQPAVHLYTLPLASHRKPSLLSRKDAKAQRCKMLMVNELKPHIFSWRLGVLAGKIFMRGSSSHRVRCYKRF